MPLARPDLHRAYLGQVHAFEGVLDSMILTSQATSGRYEEPRIGWASILFTRSCVLSVSLARLLPLSRRDGGNHDGIVWDFSSIATLTRAILECDLMLFYLGLEDPGHDEWQARLNLMHLHDATARVDMMRTLFAEEAQARGINKQRDELVERLRTNPFFAALPVKRQDHFLRGENIRFEIQDGVLERMGRNVDEFRAWYRVLSAHAHSYSLAFHRMLTDERGKGVENDIEKSWAANALHYLCSFLRPSTDRLLALFPDVPDPRLTARTAQPNLAPNSPLWRRS
jgi:hypothetical protein